MKGELGGPGWSGQEVVLLDSDDGRWKVKILSSDYVSLNWYRESDFEPGTEAELALQVLGEDYFA
jgi:hypothetical protein